MSQTTAIEPLRKFSQDADGWIPKIAALMNRRPEEATRFILMTKNAVAANEYLLQCDQKSLFLAVCNAAQTGLEPAPQLGHLYFVPRKGKVQCQVGYRGFIALASRADPLAVFQAGIVRQGDEFSYELGTSPRVSHVLSTNVKAPFTHVWASCRRANGALAADVMLIEEVNKIRDRCSESANSQKGSAYSPWNTSYEAMAKKTVLRRMLKLMPLSSEMQRAITIDEEADIQDAGLKRVGAVEALKATLKPKTVPPDDLGFDGEIPE